MSSFIIVILIAFFPIFSRPIIQMLIKFLLCLVCWHPTRQVISQFRSLHRKRLHKGIDTDKCHSLGGAYYNNVLYSLNFHSYCYNSSSDFHHDSLYYLTSFQLFLSQFFVFQSISYTPKALIILFSWSKQIDKWKIFCSFLWLSEKSPLSPP